MALKRGPNSLKSGPNSLKRGQCYVIFGQNEADSRRNFLKSNELPLWWMPTINKPNSSKDLQPIMVDAPAVVFHNSLMKCKLRRRPKTEFILDVLQSITIGQMRASTARDYFVAAPSAAVGSSSGGATAPLSSSTTGSSFFIRR
jgi:hypothetical protein